jgi:hypothetical protein
MLFIPGVTGVTGGGGTVGVTGGGTVGVTGGTLRDLGQEDLTRVAWAFAVARFQGERSVTSGSAKENDGSPQASLPTHSHSAGATFCGKV